VRVMWRNAPVDGRSRAALVAFEEPARLREVSSALPSLKYGAELLALG
jgi:hypothetical protein